MNESIDLLDKLYKEDQEQFGWEYEDRLPMNDGAYMNAKQFLTFISIDPYIHQTCQGGVALSFNTAHHGRVYIEFTDKDIFVGHVSR